MAQPHHLEHLVGALNRAQRHWEERQDTEAVGAALAGQAWTVALEREAGTPGTSVAREVGARLGWPVYDHELLEVIAGELGLRVRLLESLDEKRQSWLRECLEAFVTAPVAGQSNYLSEGAFVHRLAETILSLGAHGMCLIVGRGSAQLLPAETTLRVRLVAPLKKRVAATSLRLHVSSAEAERWVRTTESDRRAFVRDHFQKDPATVENYDLVLNSARWSVAECAEIIVRALQAAQVRTSATAAELAAAE